MLNNVPEQCFLLFYMPAHHHIMARRGLKNPRCVGFAVLKVGTVASALMSVGGWCYMSAMELVSRLTGLDRNRNEIVHDTRTILPNIR